MRLGDRRDEELNSGEAELKLTGELEQVPGQEGQFYGRDNSLGRSTCRGYHHHNRRRRNHERPTEAEKDNSLA